MDRDPDLMVPLHYSKREDNTYTQEKCVISKRDECYENKGSKRGWSVYTNCMCKYTYIHHPRSLGVASTVVVCGDNLISFPGVWN